MLGANQAAAYQGDLADFRLLDSPVTEGIYTFTFVSTTLPDTLNGSAISVDIEACCGDTLVSLALDGLLGLNTFADDNGIDTFEFVYDIELYAATPSAFPDVRFETIGLGASINSQGDFMEVTKEVVGLPTVVVPAPTFNDTLTVDSNAQAATTTCGVCRKFRITDTIFLDPDNDGDLGILSSVNNSYGTVVPVPGTLALVGLGLLAFGARRAVRQS
jgi:hypothetical protein